MDEGEPACHDWGVIADRACVEDGADSYLIQGGRNRVQTIPRTVVPCP